jgi:hypothetical protein
MVAVHTKAIRHCSRLQYIYDVTSYNDCKKIIELGFVHSVK